MDTPTSTNRRIRSKKHAPTPKMLERKKSLFTKTRSPENSPKSDDSDLGILSPLYLSESSGDGKSFGRHFSDVEVEILKYNVNVLL